LVGVDSLLFAKFIDIHKFSEVFIPLSDNLVHALLRDCGLRVLRCRLVLNIDVGLDRRIRGELRIVAVSLHLVNYVACELTKGSIINK
jgi:hypothetical protein